MTDFFLREELQGEISHAGDPVDALLAWGAQVASGAAPSEVFRAREGRKTLRFNRAGRSYFLKLHGGIGWGEVWKNLSQLRLPVTGARNEFLAVRALHRIGVDTMTVAAYASRGRNPARVRSLLVTDDLVGTISLEDYCADWAEHPPEARLRLRLIAKLADSAGRMHAAGVNHRDFYLCHFHLDPATLESEVIRCHLIDLHRAQIHLRLPRRWRVKDLAGLYFSAMDCGLGERDLLRFLRRYTPGGLRVALHEQADLWRDVAERARRLYQREHGRPPPPLVPRR